MVVVVVVTFFLACEDFGRMFDHLLYHACASLVCFCNGYYFAHNKSTPYARIGQQWLSELRRLWQEWSLTS